MQFWYLVKLSSEVFTPRSPPPTYQCRPTTWRAARSYMHPQNCSQNFLHSSLSTICRPHERPQSPLMHPNAIFYDIISPLIILSLHRPQSSARAARAALNTFHSVVILQQLTSLLFLLTSAAVASPTPPPPPISYTVLVTIPHSVMSRLYCALLPSFPYLCMHHWLKYVVFCAYWWTIMCGSS